MVTCRSQVSEYVPSQSQMKKKSIRGARRVNPLIDFDEEDEIALDISKRKVLALETPSE